MAISPETLTRALSDATRLRMLVLLDGAGELCVCDLTDALAMTQPKVSRHLAVLREAGIVLDRRSGQWIHYRLHPNLPLWAGQVLSGLADGAADREPFRTDRDRLAASAPASRPVCA